MRFPAPALALSLISGTSRVKTPHRGPLTYDEV